MHNVHILFVKGTFSMISILSKIFDHLFGKICNTSQYQDAVEVAILQSW